MKMKKNYWLVLFLIVSIVLVNTNVIFANNPVKRGGTLHFTYSMGSIETFDPLKAAGGVQKGGYAYLMYDALLATSLNPETNEVSIEPQLATDWEFSSDGKTLTLYLRKGVKFHDESDFNAEVAKWNIERWLNHPESLIKEEFNGLIDSVEIIEEYVIKLNLKKYSASLLWSLATYPPTSIVSKKAVEELGEDKFGRIGVGSGPFKFKNYIIDYELTLEKFDNYWENGEDGKPLPYLDSAVYHFIDSSVAVNRLIAGDIDLVLEPTIEGVDRIKTDKDFEVVPMESYGRHYGTLSFNWPRVLNDNEFVGRNKKVRLAFFRAIDRERISNALGLGLGFVKPNEYAWFRPISIGWNPGAWPDISYDPESARELLEEAEYTTDNRPEITITYISREPDNTIASMLLPLLNKVGFDTKIEPLERSVWISRMREGSFEVQMGGAAPIPNTLMILQMRFQTAGRGNWPMYSNPKVDDLIGKADKTVNKEERDKFIEEAILLVENDLVTGAVYFTPPLYAKVKSLKGFRELGPGNNMRSIWFDK